MDELKNQEQLKQLANCLMKFISKDNPNTYDYNVLQFIATETLRRISSQEVFSQPTFTSKEIQKGVLPEADESKASNWLNPIYTKLEDKIKVQIESPLSRFAQQEGLNCYPWIEKTSTIGGQGNTSKYKLVGLPILETKNNLLKKYEAKEGEIEYTPVKEIQATIFAKIMLGRELAMSGVRKWLMILYPVISIILITSAAYLIYLNWFLNPSIISTKTLALLVSFFIGYLIAKSYKDRADRFVEDKVIMASDWFVKYKESNVLQELVTIKNEKDEFSHKEVRLTKYVSTCNICGAKVYLDKGEPDFPRRIVGRCGESPREHVYSFDRVTLIGKKLR